MQDQVASSDAQPGESDSTSLSKATILLVDDNGDMREYVRGLLSGRFHVVSAENGRIALEIVRHTPPDLVLIDAMMPEMDGLSLLAALRKDPATSSIPVVMLSAGE